MCPQEARTVICNHEPLWQGSLQIYFLVTAADFTDYYTYNH